MRILRKGEKMCVLDRTVCPIGRCSSSEVSTKLEGNSLELVSCIVSSLGVSYIAGEEGRVLHELCQHSPLRDK